MHLSDAILWIYIVLLFLGGLFGYLKAGSKVSLVMSAVFAAVLCLCASGVVFQPHLSKILINVLLASLLVVFAIRLTKTKKFMPSGLMAVLTLATLVLRNMCY